MSSINTYRDLIVWQKSMRFVTEVYLITKYFPSTENFGLISQIRRHRGNKALSKYRIQTDTIFSR